MNGTPQPLEARQGVWSRYWQERGEAGPAGSFAAGYDGTAIEDWWRAVFAEKPQARRWLDLASGNGAVPTLWLRCQPPAGARFDAVDLASTPPQTLQALSAAAAADLHWHAGVNIEVLPFASGRFDVITSQYGLEYSNLERSLPEALRALAAGGALRLVMHHADAWPVQLARIELPYLTALLQPDGLWALAHELAAPYARSATPMGRAALAQDAAANHLRERFNAAEGRLRGNGTASELPEMHEETAHALATMFRLAVSEGADAAQAFAARWKAQLQDHVFRLQELTQRALAPATLEALCLRLQSAGLQVVQGQLHEGPRLMAWWIKADLGAA